MSPGPLLTVDSVMDKLSLYFRDGKSPSQVTEYLTHGMLMGQRAEPSDPAGWYLMTWESDATISRVSRVFRLHSAYIGTSTHIVDSLTLLFERSFHVGSDACPVFLFFFCYFGSNVFVCHFRRLIDWNPSSHNQRPMIRLDICGHEWDARRQQSNWISGTTQFVTRSTEVRSATSSEGSQYH